MKNLFLAILVSTAIVCSSCDSTEPVDLRQLSIRVEDVSSTEAWLTLRTHYLDLPANISLTANSDLIDQFTLNKSDTIIYIDSLQPETEYSLQAAAGNVISEKTALATMGTTIHKTNWEVFEFGDHGNSVLFDVAIIDENNIWAVGEVYLNDSLGQPDPTRYNLVVWDGHSWKVKRAPYYHQGQSFYNPVQSVIAFNHNQMWFCGNGVIHWDGIRFNEMPISSSVWGPFQMNKIWGSSSSDLYIAGNNGNIVHYNGSSWRKIHSGTEVNLNCICGSNSGNKIWISGYSNNSFQSTLLRLENNQVTTVWKREESGINTPPYGDIIQSIWCTENNLYVVSNDGVFRKKTKLDLPVRKIGPDFPWWKYKITGSDDNDIYAVGSRSIIWHYNGLDWVKVYEDNTTTSVLYSAAAKNGITSAVGTKVENVVYHRGIIISK